VNADSGKIHLHSIEINSAGPINGFHTELSPLTLVYALNERGKTTIVENLVACLFAQRKDGIQLRRDFIGAARVTVRGISKKPVVFSSHTGNKRKIDDLIETLQWPLTPKLFDLPVVKGAELQILRQQGGLSRSYLKSLMTRERLYETLRERLPAEIGYTEFKGGILVPKRRIGAYKSYEGFQAHLSSLEAIAEQFYSSLSRTDLLAALSRRGALKREQEQIQLAKRHSAYLLHRSTLRLAAELDRFDEQQAEDLADTVKEPLRINSELAEIQKESRRREQTAEDLRWLEEVRRRYQQVSGSRKSALQIVSFTAAGLTLLGTLAAYFFIPRLLPPLLICTLLCFCLALLATFVLPRGGSPDALRSEIRELRAAFGKRFGTPLSSSADFDFVKSRLDRELGKVEGTEKRYSSAKAAARKLQQRISELLREADRIEVPDAQWEQLAHEVKAGTRQLRIDYNLAQQRLADLGVDEVDYLEQAAAVTYSRRREEEIAGELEQLESTIRDQQDSGRELREQLIEHISRETALSESIEVVAGAIEEKKQEYRRQMRETLAQMIAGHVLNDVLESFRELEDRQLQSTLNDPRVTELIKKFSAGRYEAACLEEDGLLIENENESYP
jgi:hypothetical protein